MWTEVFGDVEDVFTDFCCECAEGKEQYSAMIEEIIKRDKAATTQKYKSNKLYAWKDMRRSIQKKFCGRIPLPTKNIKIWTFWLQKVSLIKNISPDTRKCQKWYLRANFYCIDTLSDKKHVFQAFSNTFW